jgi:2-polyprenyl-3-methyl-5-hydroxy-6-metoxy-1,4-benzoquinol methylase
VQPHLAVKGFGGIESALREHPFVGSVSVSEEEGPNGSRYSIAYVVPSGAWFEAAESHTLAPELEKRVNNWRRIFDGTYRHPHENAPDFIGWTSSYTNRPLPESEMREWLDATIARIADLAPKRVLEIGCGVGLLVEALAPRCAAYCGTDFSAIAINRLHEFTSARPELRHVHLLQREATNFDGLMPGSVDTVVLNSVVQYFPHLDYLKLVLERAAEMIAPGGHIFVGDVRHLGLLGAFHCSVQLAKAPPESTVRSLKRKIVLAIEQEKELVIDPLFFLELAHTLPRIAGAEIMVKRGDANNELTRYRYDVVLHVGEIGRDTVRDAASGGASAGARNGPNSRSRQCGPSSPLTCHVESLDPAWDDVAAQRLLESARDNEILKDLQDRLTASGPTRVNRPGSENPAPRPLATDPIAVVSRNGLAVTLGQFLRSRLPNAPLPAAVVVLSGNTALPLDSPTG